MSTTPRDAHPDIDLFLRHLGDERNMSTHTVRNYGVDLAQFHAHLSEEGRTPDFPGEITHLDVRAFMSRLDDRGSSRQTVARKIAALRSFFKFLNRRGVMEQNPARAVHTPRLEKRLPSVLTVPEMERLLAAPETGTFTGARDRAILELLYSAGLRTFELVGLDHDDVDLERRSLRTRGKGMRERVNPVGRYAVASLESYIDLKRRHFGAARLKQGVLRRARKHHCRRHVHDMSEARVVQARSARFDNLIDYYAAYNLRVGQSEAPRQGHG